MAPPASLDLDRALRNAAAALKVPPYQVNPFASVSFLREGTAFDFSIVAPIPGEGLRRTVVRRGHADLHTFLIRLMLPGRHEGSSEVVRNELIRCGVLLPAGAVPEAVYFTLPEDDLVTAAAAEAGTLAAARDQVARRGFAELRSLVHPSWLANLRAYYDGLIRQGFLDASDVQSRRFAAHDEKIAKDVHRRLTPAIAAALPEPVAPSYCYLGLYREGAVLEKHVDRDECEYTLSLTIDAQPSAARDAAWPLCLELPDGGTVRSLLAPGDGLLFKGRELPHFREALPAGRSSWSIFFHFIPAAHSSAAEPS
jgi:hypothetical protein